MKSLVYITSAVLFFFLAAFGFFLILWDNEFLIHVSLVVVNLTNLGWGVAIVMFASLILLGLGIYLFFAAIGFEPRLREHVMLSNEGGPIGLSIDAIEDFIQRRSRSIDGIREMMVRVELSDGSLNIDLKLILELQRNLPGFMHEFQARLQRDLKEVLGLQNVKEINVLIQKILPKDSGNEQVLLTKTSQEDKKPGTSPDTAAPEKQPSFTYKTSETKPPQT